MKLTDQDRSDIRDAVYSKIEQLGTHLETLADVIKNLEVGKQVYPFARGAAGVRAAQDMYQDMRVRQDRLRVLAERFAEVDA